MMAHSNTSVSHPDVDFHLEGARVGYGARARRAQAPRRRRITGACEAMALASALIVGGSVQALAQDPPDPAANRVWAGCVLDDTSPTGTVANLKADLEKGGIPVGEVSFVVVYTLANDNDGQDRGDGSFTGPVICTNSAEVVITAEDEDGDPLTERTDIPTQTHTGAATTDTVNLLSAEEFLILQYSLNFAPVGQIEKRVCHTTDANVDCFRIFPKPPPPPEP